MNKINFKKFISTFIISTLIGALLAVIALAMSGNITHRGWVDAVIFGAVFLFAGLWMAFVVSQGVFDVIVYSIKKIGMSIFAKRPEKSLSEYMQEDRNISKYVLFGILASSILYMIIGLILYLTYSW